MAITPQMIFVIGIYTLIIVFGLSFIIPRGNNFISRHFENIVIGLMLIGVALTIIGLLIWR